MSAELAIQRALYAKLAGAESLAALLAADQYEGSPSLPAVYDHVPQVEASEDTSLFPFVVLGEHTTIPFDTDDVHGQETTVSLHVFDRHLGRARAKQIVAAIYDLLHDGHLEIEGQHLIFCYWEFGESVPDPDVMTQHEVTRFRIVTQEAS